MSPLLSSLIPASMPSCERMRLGFAAAAAAITAKAQKSFIVETKKEEVASSAASKSDADGPAHTAPAPGSIWFLPTTEYQVPVDYVERLLLHMPFLYCTRYLPVHDVLGACSEVVRGVGARAGL